ncbi:MAG: hypothetical protein H0T84_12630 [Tatlockia sp.]|nr:hypothetical protein [Tatlockia sp.]
MPIFNFKDFTATTHISRCSKNAHDVSKGTLKGSKKVWFCKEVGSLDSAILEVIAQEFFRLVIPYQPETRLAFDESTGIYYILSEEVKNFNFSESNFRKQVKIGLGQTLLVALFLEEDDLKFNNIGLDYLNRVIKIDGGLCFSGKEQRQYNLSAAAIDQLPFPVDSQPNHWLDIVKSGKRHAGSFIVSPNLSSSLEFRNDVNLAMLKICLIPDCFIFSFVDFLTDGHSIKEKFIQKLISRRDELTRVALENSSFIVYLNTEIAKQEALKFLDQMISFKSGRTHLFTDFEQKDHITYEFKIKNRSIFSSYAIKTIAEIRIILLNNNTERALDNFHNMIKILEELMPLCDDYEKINMQLKSLLESLLAKQQKLHDSKESPSSTNANDIVKEEICELHQTPNSAFTPSFWQSGVPENNKNSNYSVENQLT